MDKTVSKSKKKEKLKCRSYNFEMSWLFHILSYEPETQAK